MKLTNNQIYLYAQKLSRIYFDSSLYLPARINFCIQKNRSTILALGEEIEKARTDIIYHYGDIQPDSSCQVPADKIAIAQAELNDLLEMEQEVNILKFSINKFTDDTSLSIEQMDAIMFMIEEA